MNFQLDHLCTPPETESNIQCNIMSILWGAKRDCEMNVSLDTLWAWHTWMVQIDWLEAVK